MAEKVTAATARDLLPAAELRMKGLLDQLNAVESTLRVLKPAAPERFMYKQQKETVLAAYRQAKARVKELRRSGGSTPETSDAQRAAVAVLTDGTVLQKLYVALAEARDRDHTNDGVFTVNERVVIDEFLDVWEAEQS